MFLYDYYYSNMECVNMRNLQIVTLMCNENFTAQQLISIPYTERTLFHPSWGDSILMAKKVPDKECVHYLLSDGLNPHYRDELSLIFGQKKRNSVDQFVDRTWNAIQRPVPAITKDELFSLLSENHEYTEQLWSLLQDPQKSLARKDLYNFFPTLMVDKSCENAHQDAIILHEMYREKGVILNNIIEYLRVK